MQDTEPTPTAFFPALQGKSPKKEALTRIMVSRSEIDMKRIKEEYKKLSGKTLYQEILVRKPDPDDQH